MPINKYAHHYQVIVREKFGERLCLSLVQLLKGRINCQKKSGNGCHGSFNVTERLAFYSSSMSSATFELLTHPTSPIEKLTNLGAESQSFY